MSSDRKITFIINPASGSRIKPGADIIRAFFDSNDSITFFESKEKNHAVEIAATAAKEGADAVIAIGGDGTVNEVARSLNGTPCALGIIPCGSGNGLARHHKIPFDVAQAIACIKRFNVVNHDAISINGQLSFNVSGIGFDAHIANLFGRNGKRGFKSYIKLVFKEFSSYTEKEICITTANGIVKQKIMLAAIANASQFGNNALIAPAADTNDGIADITLVRKMKGWQLPSFMYKVFNNRVSESPHSNLLTGEKFNIDCEEPLPLHLDGEPCGYAKQFNIQVMKGTLKLIVP